MEYIALDSHKRCSFASVEEHTGAILREARIEHQRGAIAEFLSAWTLRLRWRRSEIRLML